MNILSLFDGMSCGQIAFKQLDIPIENYYAYEIDKYAIKTTIHNFPNTKELGDVFEADFTQYKGIDFLVGGSPCTFWSIAQSPDKRETTASGLGWELFSQYVRALHEAQPKYFIYENNKSMAKAIYESISAAFGFEPIMINSALVSAQNRQRYYWVGKRNEDGTYSKVDVQQPKDKGILLKDILDGIAFKDKQNCIDANYYKGGNYSNLHKQSGQRNMIVEPVRIPDTNTPDKARTLNAHYSNNAGTGEGSLENRLFNPNPCKQQVDLIAEPINVTKDNKSHTIKAQYHRNTIANFVSNKGFDASGVAEPINTFNNEGKKSRTVMSGYYKYGEATILTNKGFKGGTTAIAEKVDTSVQVGALPRPNGELSTSQGFRVYDIDGESVTLKAGGGGAGGKTGLYTIPVNQPLKVGIYPTNDGHMVNSQGMRIYSTNGKSVTQTAQSGGKGSYTGLYAIPIEKDSEEKYLSKRVCTMTSKQGDRIYDINAKSICLTANGGNFGGYSGAYAIPIEFDNQNIPIKAISLTDGKTYKVYHVKDNTIEIKGKTYPIKLADGYYIIRKLTVNECKRLQTVPEWFEFPVSDTQAYKCLGNGWTVEVIMHLINSVFKEKRDNNDIKTD